MARNLGDLETLEMALVGFRAEREKLDQKIREIEGLLKGRRPAAQARATKKPAGAKRVLSPAARRRIAAAQEKRWAEHRKRAAQAKKA